MKNGPKLAPGQCNYSVIGMLSGREVISPSILSRTLPAQK